MLYKRPAKLVLWLHSPLVACHNVAGDRVLRHNKLVATGFVTSTPHKRPTYFKNAELIVHSFMY